MMCSLTAFLLLNTGVLKSQKDIWALYPTDLDFTTGTTTGTLPATLPDVGFLAENSVYIDGDLQFYVRCQLQGINGSFELLDIHGNIYGVSNKKGRFSNKELEIVPVPGTCDLYCVMFTSPSSLVLSEFAYFEVQVLADGTLKVFPIKAQNTMPTTSTGLAISKRIGTTNNRDIYMVGRNVIHKYRLDELGIEFLEETFLGSSTNSGDILEADLSPDGDYLAWGGNNNKVYVYDIFGGGILYTINMPGSSQYSQVAGVEFYQAEGATPRLYVSGELGLYTIEDFATANPVVSLLPNTADLGYTQLELAKDGLLYGVTRSTPSGPGFLTSINPVNNNITQSTTVVKSYESQFVGSGNIATWGLPQQIDGEGDELFLGIDPPELSNFTLENTALPETVSNAPTFYDCNSLNYAFDATGQFTEYTLEIISVNPIDGTPIFGSGYLYYNQVFPASTSLPIDLRCLDDPISCDLFKNVLGQTFIINVIIKHCGVNLTFSGYFELFGPPDPITIDFEMASGSGAVCQATTLANACLVGNNGLSFNASNSSGDIDYYRVDIQKVDCSGSPLVTQLYSGTNEPYPASTGLNLNLNALYINGAQGYFADNPGIVDGSCYLINLTLGNVCGEASDFSYFEVDPTLYLQGGGGGTAFSIDEKSINTAYNRIGHRLVPQPVQERANLMIDSAGEQTFELIVYSANGQPLFQQNGSTSEQTSLDLSALPSGIYFYQLRLEGALPANGKFVKQ